MRTAIVGIGETVPAFTADRAVTELVLEACSAAIADAGLRPGDIDAVITDARVMSSLSPIEETAPFLGVGNRAMAVYYGNAGVGIMGAPAIAEALITSGRATNVLVYFGVDWGSKRGAAYGHHSGNVHKDTFERPVGWYGQPTFFAALGRRYLDIHGLDESVLAQVAIDARTNAQQHPGALKRKPLDRDGYDQSRMIATPLRALDCCLLSDGAGAYVITSAERAADGPHRAVAVAGVEVAAAPKPWSSFLSLVPTTPSQLGESTPKALAAAGLTHADIDVVQVYDCFTVSVLLQLEAAGFAPAGESAAWLRESEMPVNTHGGLLSHSYLLGMSHVTEAVRQLRGEAVGLQVADAQHALVLGPPGDSAVTLALSAA